MSSGILSVAAGPRPVRLRNWLLEVGVLCLRGRSRCAFVVGASAPTEILVGHDPLWLTKGLLFVGFEHFCFPPGPL